MRKGYKVVYRKNKKVSRRRENVMMLFSGDRKQRPLLVRRHLAAHDAEECAFCFD